MIWADLMGWQVPTFHVTVTEWLGQWERRVKVLKMARGFAKSTIVGTNVAHDIYVDPAEAHVLAQGADDKVAAKMSRHARHVVRRHPLCAGLYNREQWGVFAWSVLGNASPRDPSCAAAGIMSNVTASRASKAIFDDVEVPKNIKTPGARELIRERTSEATHILVPGGGKLFIGTPHTVDSIYEEQERDGADTLAFPLFAHHKRYENDKRQRVFGFKPRGVRISREDLYVFHNKELLVDGRDYQYRENAVHFKKFPIGTVDCYAGNTWPSRFNRAEIQFRRRQVKTTNEFDSQYQLHARPIHEMRLDPDRLIAYDVEPRLEYANKQVVMRLGDARIATVSTRWDPSLGKVTSDASAFVVIFQDEAGVYYWHVAEGLAGDIDAQCERVREICIALQLPSVTVEVNNLGGFVPAVLRKHLVGTGIAVVEDVASTTKNKDILDGLEPVMSAGVLWAHERLWEKQPGRERDGSAIDQMRDWIPTIKEGQSDDYLDAAARAILATPIRIGQVVGSVVPVELARWRPNSGVYTAKVER